MHVLWYSGGRKDIDKMTNKEKDLIIEALEALKHEIYFGSYLTSHSSMNIEEKGYAKEKIDNIDALIKEVNADKDSEKIKLFDYLCNHWATRAYNPKGYYYVISFTIDDASINKSIDKYLNKNGVLVWKQ